METNTEADLRASMQAWDQGAWCLAAVALAGRPDSDPATRAAADELLVALGVKEHPDAPFRDLGTATAEQVAGQASAPLLQVAGLLGDRRFAWMEQSDEALLAQGATSAQAAPAFAQFLLPVMEGLAERLGSPGVRMLDVGTGVGALAVAYAEVFPALSVTGLDVMERVLASRRRGDPLGAGTSAARWVGRGRCRRDHAEQAGRRPDPAASGAEPADRCVGEALSNLPGRRLVRRAGHVSRSAAHHHRPPPASCAGR